MDVYEAIELRKSVRAFLDKSVEKEKLDRVLEAGRAAPSARNAQEWRFLVVQDEEKRKQLVEAANGQQFVGEAPVVIVCCGVSQGRNMRCGHDPVLIDVAIAMDHMTLAAAAEGLGTCWVGSFYPEKVRKLLGIPEEIVIVELLPLGYPRDPGKTAKSRLSIDEIVKYDQW